VSCKIGEADFIRMFQLEPCGFPEEARARLANMNLNFRPSSKEELAEYAVAFMKMIGGKLAPRSRDENLAAFERGWTENLEAFKASSPNGFETALKPRYFRGAKFFRYDGDVVMPENHQIEYEAFIIARLCLFHKYLRQADFVCELGCGSCANLLLLSTLLPKTELLGLDWTNASSKIAAALADRTRSRISGRTFDLLAPDKSLKLPEGAAIISLHAFEQLGEAFEPVLDFMLAAKPSIVVQYEPVLDFYDPESLPDRLALAYCEQRNYLKGYYAALKELERQGRIRILEARRPGLGGVLHEQSIIAWKPLD